MDINTFIEKSILAVCQYEYGYDIINDKCRRLFVGGGSLPYRKGGAVMTVFETIVLMITFGSLIIAILSFHQKK